MNKQEAGNQTQCPNKRCKATINPDDNYCGKCGYRIFKSEGHDYTCEFCGTHTQGCHARTC